MRQARLKVPSHFPTGFYHCLSRVVDKQFLFHAKEKEKFASLMRELEEFCEVKVLTYCLMSNHFHILLEVPKAPQVKPSAEVILQKLAKLTCHQDLAAIQQQLLDCRASGNPQGEQLWLNRFYARMWDVSAYMKLLKQRFTQWYNTRTGREGTLWENRFKSVLVDSAGRALVTMAAYIELNPVRAGIVQDPGDYRWNGYSEALAGLKPAQAGVQRLVEAFLGKPESPARSLEVYRMRLALQGAAQKEDDGPSPSRERSRQQVLEVLKNKGKLPLSVYLRHRVRYFTDGVVFGSRQFVDEIFAQYRPRFGPNRKSGARRLRGLLKEDELFALRDLQVDVFG
jgi:REP element-mobilizing transposase RayT